jgi:hypothetical protein
MHQECPERLRFSRKVVEALNAICALTDGPNAALELLLAQDELKNATRAFDEHLAEHGCLQKNKSSTIR